MTTASQIPHSYSGASHTTAQTQRHFYRWFFHLCSIYTETLHLHAIFSAFFLDYSRRPGRGGKQSAYPLENDRMASAHLRRLNFAMQRIKNFFLATVFIGSSSIGMAGQPNEQGTAQKDPRNEAHAASPQADPHCTATALHLPLDHGPHATTNPDNIRKKILECESKNRPENK